MADQTATFRIVLADEVSGSAKDAAEALEQFDSAIAKGQKNLAAMQRSLKTLQGATTPNVALINKLKTSIAAQKNEIAAMEGKYLELSGGVRQAAKSTGSFADRLKALQGQATAMPGPLGAMVNGFKQLSDLVGGGKIALGIVAISAALAALVVATAKAIKSLYEYGVAQADARRSEQLRLEGLTKLRFMFQKIPGDAKQMQAAIDKVAASTPTARNQIAGMAEQLHKMGLRGNNFTEALEGMSIKMATQGSEAANAWAGWAAHANMAGGSVKKLADDVRARLGGVAQKQMASLTVQTEKQKEAFDALFADLDMDSYLNAWKEVRDLLGQSTNSGKALKLIVTTMLKPLITASTEAAPYIKKFFQGLIISALKFAIMVVKLRNAILDLFGSGKAEKQTKDFTKALDLGKIAFWGFLGAITAAGLILGAFAIKLAILVTPALWAMATAAWAALLPFLPFIAAFLAVGAAILVLMAYWDELKIAFEQIDWVQAGLDVIEGLLAGILPGGRVLIDAVKGLAGSAIEAFKDAIGAKSPATAFIAVGKTIPQGVAEGVDEDASKAQDATRGMLGDVPELGGAPGGPAAAKGGASGGAGGRGGVTISIGEIAINATTDKPAQLAIDFRRELEKVLDGLSLEMGAPTPEGA